MRTPALVAAAPLLLTLSAGCSAQSYTESGNGVAPGAVVIGSGRFVAETRQVQGISAIVVTSGAHAIVTHSGTESLEITAEDNILPFIVVSVTNGRLAVGFKSGSFTTHGIDLRIGVRDLRKVEASGGSRIDLDAVDGDFSITLSGAAQIASSGLASHLDLELSGASRMQAPDVTARVVSANISGASSALLRIVDSLVVNASGESVFEFSGDPVVQASASGGSVVRRLGP